MYPRARPPKSPTPRACAHARAAACSRAATPAPGVRAQERRSAASTVPRDRIGFVWCGV